MLANEAKHAMLVETARGDRPADLLWQAGMRIPLHTERGRPRLGIRSEQRSFGPEKSWRAARALRAASQPKLRPQDLPHRMRRDVFNRIS